MLRRWSLRRRKHHAEVVVAHIGREIIADHAAAAGAGEPVKDAGVENLEQGELLPFVIRGEVHVCRNDLEFQGVALAVRVVPVGQGVETPVDHRQGIAQVLLAVFSAGQVGEVRRGARSRAGRVVLVESGGADTEGERVCHGGLSGGEGPGQAERELVHPSCRVFLDIR